jgi:hypothetical protein
MDNQMQILLEQIQQAMDKQTITLQNTIDAKLEPIMKENKQLKEDVSTLKSRIYNLEKITKKNNFILHGVAERETSASELMELVLNTLNTLSESANINQWDKWEISNVQRLGRKQDDKNRPILITITLAWRKIEVLKNNKKFPSSIYATEDYPKEVLEKRRELKTKMTEELQKGKIAYIRYDRLIVKEATSEKRKRAPTDSPSSEPSVKEDMASSSSSNNPTKVTKTNAFTLWRAPSLAPTNKNNM